MAAMATCLLAPNAADQGGVVYGPPRGSHCGMAQMEEAVTRYLHQH